MNNKFSIKGLANRLDLSNKTLQSMHTHTITGSISSNLAIEDLFEVSIFSTIVNSSSVVFKDMNLNIFNCKFTFNVIATDNSNKGIFLNYDYNSLITYKSFKALTSYNLLLIDSYFYKVSSLSIDFSLVVALDFSNEDNLNVPLHNPLLTTNNTIESISNAEISLFFDKEFI